MSRDMRRTTDSFSAAPFHPQGKQPQAPCPQCAQAGDDSPKKLYGIRGLGDGEHDPAIPQTWFSCPPIRLDGAAPGMDAVRVSTQHDLHNGHV